MPALKSRRRLAAGTTSVTLLLALGWSVFGEVPVFVERSGRPWRDRTEIRAPKPGALVSLHLSVGQAITPGQTIALIRTDPAELKMLESRLETASQSHEASQGTFKPLIADACAILRELHEQLPRLRDELATAEADLALLMAMGRRRDISRRQFELFRERVDEARKTLEAEESRMRQLQAAHTFPDSNRRDCSTTRPCA